MAECLVCAKPWGQLPGSPNNTTHTQKEGHTELERVGLWTAVTLGCLLALSQIWPEVTWQTSTSRNQMGTPGAPTLPPLLPVCVLSPHLAHEPQHIFGVLSSLFQVLDGFLHNVGFTGGKVHPAFEHIALRQEKGKGEVLHPTQPLPQPLVPRPPPASCADPAGKLLCQVVSPARTACDTLTPLTFQMGPHTSGKGLGYSLAWEPPSPPRGLVFTHLYHHHSLWRPSPLSPWTEHRQSG